MKKYEMLKTLPDGRMDPRNSARYLGLSEKTLAIKRCQGNGPKFVRCGGRIYYFMSDLDEWILKDGKRTSTASGVKIKNLEEI